MTTLPKSAIVGVIALTKTPGKEHIDYMLPGIPRRRFLEVGAAAQMIVRPCKAESTFPTRGRAIC